MAKFIYRMQSILDVKYKLEDQAKTAFGIANARLMEEEEALRALMARRAMYEQRAKELMEGAIDVVAIRENKTAIDSMKTIIKDQMIKVQVARRNVEAARVKLNAEMADRKAHEKLKERAFEEFKQELAAEEAKEIDQLVSYTYSTRG